MNFNHRTHLSTRKSPIEASRSPHRGIHPDPAHRTRACSSSGGQTPTTAPATTETGSLTDFTVTVVGSTTDGALWSGIERGVFKEEGLNVKVSTVPNPAASLAAAQGNQSDIAFAPGIPLLNALSQGIGVQIVAGSHGYDPAVVGKPDEAKADDTGLIGSAKNGITSVSDLRGKTIVVPTRKAHMEVFISAALEKVGIDPQTEVNWVVLDQTSAVAALNEGRADAAGLVSPQMTQALEAGNPLLVAPISFFGAGTTSYWVSGTSTIQQKPEAIQAFQRAIKKSNDWANEHPAEATEAGLKALNSALTVADVPVPFWSTDFAEKNLENTMNKMVKMGFLPAPIDLSKAFYRP